MKRFALLLLLFSCSAFATHTENMDKVAAFVNDDVITLSELNHQIEITKKELFASGQAVPNDTILRRQVLSHLIDNSLQLQVARKMEMKVSAERVSAAIKQVAERNHITVAQLKTQILAEGMNFKAYKDEVRNQILIGEVQQNLVGSKIVITPQQVSDFVNIQKKELAKNVEYHIQHLMLSLPDTPDTQTIMATRKKANQLYHQLSKGEDFDKTVAKFSEADDALQSGDLGWKRIVELPHAFVTPAKDLKLNQISKPIQTSNGFHILKLVGKRQKSNKHYSTQYHVRQIFMKADDLTSNQEVERKLLEIRKHLQRGESFAEYAKTFSQDSSASKGGDMGWIYADESPMALANAMSSAQIKSIGKPIRTNLGWHLIQVLGQKRVEDSERVLKNNARQMLYRRKMQMATQSWLQSLRGQAYVKVVKIDT